MQCSHDDVEVQASNRFGECTCRLCHNQVPLHIGINAMLERLRVVIMAAEAKIVAGLLVLVLLPALAGAETINVRSGSLDFQDPWYGDSAVYISGRNFEFEGWAGNAFLEPAGECQYGCDAGESILVGAHVSGNDLPGVVTWDGVEYPDVGGMNSLNQMRLDFSGWATVPRFTDVPVRIQRVRGNLDGIFWHDNVGDVFRCPTTVVVTWQHGDGIWYLDRVQYILNRR